MGTDEPAVASAALLLVDLCCSEGIAFFAELPLVLMLEEEVTAFGQSELTPETTLCT